MNSLELRLGKTEHGRKTICFNPSCDGSTGVGQEPEFQAHVHARLTIKTKGFNFHYDLTELPPPKFKRRKAITLPRAVGAVVTVHAREQACISPCLEAMGRRSTRAGVGVRANFLLERSPVGHALGLRLHSRDEIGQAAMHGFCGRERHNETADDHSAYGSRRGGMIHSVGHKCDAHISAC